MVITLKVEVIIAVKKVGVVVVCEDAWTYR
jgi:hypothetical protein